MPRAGRVCPRAGRLTVKKLLLYPPFEPERLAQIQQAAGSMTVANPADEAEAARQITDATGFIGKITPALLAKAQRLQWVQSPTASLEHYVFPALIAHPCTLTNMRGLFSDIIADQVMGYVIAFARNLHIYIRQQMARQWHPIGGGNQINYGYGPGLVTGVDRAHQHLGDCTMGIIGLGAIGGELARRAQAFGMRVLAVDPVRTQAPEGVALGGLDQTGALLNNSDYVVIAAPHTPRTQGSFGLESFRQMKPSARFINIGRGAIVDLSALTQALGEGIIAGAALDVYETEPLPAGHPLWGMENAILTPHIAGYSPRIAGRHLEVLLDNVARHRGDEPLRNVVNKAEWF
ncbi:MAG: D-2-hydroxyacid dehydrogenase [Acidobacteriia bacterium]|nr:D-2-hydroxyacid dehydrogenase [Terriglobia bacterium]